MNKFQAFRWRLLPTLAALLLAVAIVRLLWFPGAFFELAGAGKLILIMSVANVVIGPGLTALVYRPGKPGLAFDLGAIAVLEVVALGWAMATLHARQPVYTVFAVDRFEIVTGPEIDSAAVRYDRLRHRPGHEPRLVYAELPTDPDIKSRLIDETVFLGLADIDRRPEFWQPYVAGLPVLKSAAMPLAGLLETGDERAEAVAHWLEDNDVEAGAYTYLPLRGKQSDAMMILHADIGYPVDILQVDPW